MLPTRPITKSFKIALRCDRALDHERFERAAAEYKLLDDEQRARTPEPESFDAAYRRCVERLDFAEITKQGERPTFFVLAPIDGLMVRRLVDRYGDVTPEKLGAEGLSIVLRIGLITIENWPDAPDIEKKPEQPWGLLVPQQAIDDIDRVAVELGGPWGAATSELASLVIARSVLPSGK